MLQRVATKVISKDAGAALTDDFPQSLGGGNGFKPPKRHRSVAGRQVTNGAFMPTLLPPTALISSSPFP